MAAAIQITAAGRSHLLPVFKAMCESGWRVVQAPVGAEMARNGQFIELRTANRSLRFRLFVYKVTGSSRGNPHERRIEITSTYQNRIQPISRFPDFVLGFDPDSGIYVGVDPERIRHGGKTGNASSFFDIEGLSWRDSRYLHIRQRHAELFPAGVEYHAFIKPSRLAEYFFSHDEVHGGTYSGHGLFCHPILNSHSCPMEVDESKANGTVLVLENFGASQRRLNIRQGLLAAAERGDFEYLKRKKTTPEEFAVLKQQMEENGRLGEEFVVDYERKRLAKAGRRDLAGRVRWLSQESIGEGFDVLSFEQDAKKRYIEVKSTISAYPDFEMSSHEWNTASKWKESYFVYRVTEVRTRAKLVMMNNLLQLELDGRIKRTPTGWRVSPIA